MRKTYIEKMTDYMNRRITELNKVNFRVLSAPSLFSPSSSPYFLNNHDFLCVRSYNNRVCRFSGCESESLSS